jgi:hypothetical protein
MIVSCRKKGKAYSFLKLLQLDPNMGNVGRRDHILYLPSPKKTHTYHAKA